MFPHWNFTIELLIQIEAKDRNLQNPTAKELETIRKDILFERQMINPTSALTDRAFFNLLILFDLHFFAGLLQILPKKCKSNRINTLSKSLVTKCGSRVNLPNEKFEQMLIITPCRKILAEAVAQKIITIDDPRYKAYLQDLEKCTPR